MHLNRQPMHCNVANPRNLVVECFQIRRKAAQTGLRFKVKKALYVCDHFSLCRILQIDNARDKDIFLYAIFQRVSQNVSISRLRL